MTIEQLQQRLQEAERQLPAVTAQAGQDAAKSLAALVASRVRQRGLSADGQPFSPYSSNETGAWRFIGKSRTSGADAVVRKKAKARESLSYREFRSINGLNTAPKNFEFTGETWRDFDGTSSVRGAIIRIELDARRSDLKQRLEWLSDQEGRNIIEVAADEKRIVADLISSRIARLING